MSGMGEAQAAPAPGRVTVLSGPNRTTVPAGRTIGAIREGLQTMWGMTAGHVAYIGKEKPGDDYVTQAGEQVEFHRREGEKG